MPEPPTSPYVVATQQRVAEFFEVSRQTVKSNWIPRGMPGEPGAYDLRAITRWYVADLKRQYKRTGLDDDGQLEREINRRIRAADLLTAESEARFRKLRADKADAVLLPAHDVSREVIEWCIRIRTPLLALADRITNLMPGDLKATIKRLVGDAVRLVLKEAYDSGPLGQSLDDLILLEANKILDRRRRTSDP